MYTESKSCDELVWWAFAQSDADTIMKQRLRTRGSRNQNLLPCPCVLSTPNAHTWKKEEVFLYFSMIPRQFMIPKPKPFPSLFTPISLGLYTLLWFRVKTSSGESPSPVSWMLISTKLSCADACNVTVPP